MDFDCLLSAVLLVQDATGLEPTLVQPKSKSRKEKQPVSLSAPVMDDKSSAASVSSAQAQDDDLLKAVSQLLQQTQEVCMQLLQQVQEVYALNYYSRHKRYVLKNSLKFDIFYRVFPKYNFFSAYSRDICYNLWNVEIHNFIFRFTL